jgi:signal transduction histidine kinase
MSATVQNSPDSAVFLLTHTGNDARNAGAVLDRAGIRTKICASVRDFCERGGDQTGALVVSEELFDQPSLSSLLEFLVRQPPWSDIPIILLTATGEIHQRTYNILEFLGARANVSLLEKPLRAITLVSVVRTALRARNRQFEVRDLLERHEQTNALLADKAGHLESLVQQRTVKLQETVGELESFSYSIAHDLRAPLRSLQGFSNILLTDYSRQLEPNARIFLHRITRAAGRMDQLIRDVLSYSRIVRAELPLEKIELEQLLYGIIDTYPMLAPEKAEVELKGPFPPVLGNEAILTQIFSNLMGNGVKFVRPGTPPRLKLWAEPRGRRVRVFVEDNGIGIAADQHERIFGIFQQVNKSFEGTGIGLAIVNKAVERIGGSVGLRSEPDHGSTFWIDVQAA